MGVGIHYKAKRTNQRIEQFMEGKMLSSEEKKTLLNAIEDIKDKTETVFKCLESKVTEKDSKFIDIFVTKVNITNEIKSLKRLVKRY